MQPRLVQQIATSFQHQPRHFGKATSIQQSYVESNCLKIPASSLRVPYTARTYDSTYARLGSIPVGYVESNCLKIPASSLRVPYASQTYDSTYARLGSIPVGCVVDQAHPKVDLSSLKPLAPGMRVAYRSHRLQIREEIAGWNADAVKGVTKTLRVGRENRLRWLREGTECFAIGLRPIFIPLSLWRHEGGRSFLQVYVPKREVICFS